MADVYAARPARVLYETWVNGHPDWLRIEVPVTECPRIKPSFLNRMNKGMSERKFRQDFLSDVYQR